MSIPSKTEIVTEFKRLTNETGKEIISRNFWRSNANFSEHSVYKYFGTWAEFLKTVGAKPTRHQQKIYNDTAKHAAKDRQNAMNVEKASWAGKYLRDTTGTYQSVLVGSDLHDKLCDAFYRRLFIDTARRVQPEYIILNGDIFDLAEFGKYTNDPREYDVLGSIRWVHGFLADLRAVAPDANIIFVEGNHEFRLLRHLSEASPSMMTLLGDLHGWTVAKLLGLEEFEVNYVAKMDLRAFTESDIKKELRKNYIVLHDALLFEHYPQARNKGYPGSNGHHHKHQVWPGYSPVFDSYEWHQTGGGHRREASYTAGEKWSNGFLLCHMNIHSRRTQMEYIDCTYDHCIIGGQLYERTEDEKVPAINRFGETTLKFRKNA
jgi:hypothetical protein